MQFFRHFYYECCYFFVGYGWITLALVSSLSLKTQQHSLLPKHGIWAFRSENISNYSQKIFNIKFCVCFRYWLQPVASLSNNTECCKNASRLQKNFRLCFYIGLPAAIIPARRAAIICWFFYAIFYERLPPRFINTTDLRCSLDGQ